MIYCNILCRNKASSLYCSSLFFLHKIHSANGKVIIQSCTRTRNAQSKCAIHLHRAKCSGAKQKNQKWFRHIHANWPFLLRFELLTVFMIGFRFAHTNIFGPPEMQQMKCAIFNSVLLFCTEFTLKWRYEGHIREVIMSFSTNGIFFCFL